MIPHAGGVFRQGITSLPPNLLGFAHFPSFLTIVPGFGSRLWCISHWRDIPLDRPGQPESDARILRTHPRVSRPYTSSQFPAGNRARHVWILLFALVACFFLACCCEADSSVSVLPTPSPTPSHAAVTPILRLWLPLLVEMSALRARDLRRGQNFPREIEPRPVWQVFWSKSRF